MNISEIEQSISDYFHAIVKQYNNDLTIQYSNRLKYYNSSEHDVPKKFRIDKLDDFDRMISPLVQSDNTGMKLRSYNYITDDYLLDSLSTLRNGK